MGQLDIFGGETLIATPAAPKARKAPAAEQFALFALDEAVADAAKPADERFAGVIVRDLGAGMLI